MGLFDEVIVEYPLVETPELQGARFQTKSFSDPFLEVYKITKEGRLLRLYEDRVLVPEEERPYFGTPDWDQRPFARYVGMFKAASSRWEDTNFHGIINFYTLYQGKFYLYTAKFTDGTLVNLVLEVEDATANSNKR